MSTVFIPREARFNVRGGTASDCYKSLGVMSVAESLTSVRNVVRINVADYYTYLTRAEAVDLVTALTYYLVEDGEKYG